MAKKRMDPAIRKIRSNRGLCVRVAEECGISRAAVHQWKRVPSERAQIVARALDMPLHQVRPDIFPKP